MINIYRRSKTMQEEIPVYELAGVCFSYPYEQPVLDNINLKIMPGEKICILGANGSGKSTLLKLLSGIIFPQKGEIKAFGSAITEKTFSDSNFSKTYHRKVGFIFQNSDAQLFCSTVKEEIAFGPLQLGLSHEQVMERVDDVMGMLDIFRLKDKTPFKLSGGEKKKVAIASVLVLNPEVLILDEPTNGLDPRTQRWLVGLLLELSASGRTIITSTHNLELVGEISDRAAVFSEAHRIVKDSAADDVLKDIRLLKEVNLVDEYYHMHGDSGHTHYHMHNYKKT
jgi:cobalt/nickel transport system ATP-binding protein